MCSLGIVKALIPGGVDDLDTGLAYILAQGFYLLRIRSRERAVDGHGPAQFYRVDVDITCLCRICGVKGGEQVAVLLSCIVRC